jgi:hypothetical protein
MKYYKVFDIFLGYKVSVWGKCLHCKNLNQFLGGPFLKFVYNPSNTKQNNYVINVLVVTQYY